MEMSNWEKRSWSESDTEHITFQSAGTMCDDSWLAVTVYITVKKL